MKTTIENKNLTLGQLKTTLNSFHINDDSPVFIDSTDFKGLSLTSPAGVIRLEPGTKDGNLVFAVVITNQTLDGEN